MTVIKEIIKNAHLTETIRPSEYKTYALKLSGITLEPNNVLYNGYPVAVYKNPTEEFKSITHEDLTKNQHNQKPLFDEARVGVADGQAFILANTPSGLDLTSFTGIDSVYKVKSNGQIHLIHENDTYVFVPTLGGCCGSSLRTFNPWVFAPLGQLERKDYALPSSDSKDEAVAPSKRTRRRK